MLNEIYSSNSNFLKAEDLQGKKPALTISTAEVVEKDYGEGPKKQIVLGFSQTDKVLGLNFTNASKIAELTGTEDFNRWVGTTIKLYVEKVKFNNRLVDAIRIFPELPTGIRPDAPQQFSGPATATAPAIDDDDSIPF